VKECDDHEASVAGSPIINITAAAIPYSPACIARSMKRVAI
jgi:hypothetical protein